jgi:L-methionine (R)-S-oxide reductase
MESPDYNLLKAQFEALVSGEPDVLANASNFVGLLFNSLDNVNWLGIYVLRDDELVLGPFQGKPACIRIPIGRGVCGTAAATLETQRVSNVHEFPGHIPCDDASLSEIVVPLVIDGALVGVLDIDSPTIDRFSASDQEGVELLCRTFCESQSGRNFI